MENNSNEEMISKLKESEQKFRILFESSPAVITISNLADSKLIDVNNNFTLLTGIKKEDAINKLTLDLDLWTKKEDRDWLLLTLKEKGEAKNKEFQFKNKDGQILTGLLSAQILHVADKPYIVASIYDITDRKMAEEKLKQSENKFKNLFNNSGIGMFRSRLDGSELLDANDQFLSVTGYTRDESVGKPSMVLWYDPKERDDILKLLKENDRLSRFKFRLKNKAGEIKYCVISLFLYQEDKILEGTIEDMTEQKKAGDELAVKFQEIEKLNRLMVGRELSMVDLKDKIAELEAKLAPNKI